MSVHGEFSRALEAMLDRLRGLRHSRSREWIDALEAARLGIQPDLSAAASEALRVLDSIQQDSDAQDVEGLRDPREHLRKHCRAILGDSGSAR